MSHVDLWEEQWRAQRERCHEAYMASPTFPQLAAVAKARGFRKATLPEIHASAEAHQGAPELHSWRGGLWVATAA